MMFRLILLMLSYSLAVFAVENSFGTTGYLRIQTSLEKDKANTCFKANGASTKYRLGNECDTWIELGVFQDLTFENDIVMHNQVRPVFGGDNNKKIKFIRFD